MSTPVGYFKTFAAWAQEIREKILQNKARGKKKRQRATEIEEERRSKLVLQTWQSLFSILLVAVVNYLVNALLVIAIHLNITYSF